MNFLWVTQLGSDEQLNLLSSSTWINLHATFWCDPYFQPLVSQFNWFSWKDGAVKLALRFMETTRSYYHYISVIHRQRSALCGCYSSNITWHCNNIIMTTAVLDTECPYHRVLTWFGGNDTEMSVCHSRFMEQSLLKLDSLITYLNHMLYVLKCNLHKYVCTSNTIQCV